MALARELLREPNSHFEPALQPPVRATTSKGSPRVASASSVSQLSGVERSRLLTLLDRVVRSPSPTLSPSWNLAVTSTLDKRFVAAASTLVSSCLRKLGINLRQAEDKLWLTWEGQGPLTATEYGGLRRVLAESLEEEGDVLQYSQTATSVVQGCREVLFEVLGISLAETAEAMAGMRLGPGSVVETLQSQSQDLDQVRGHGLSLFAMVTPCRMLLSHQLRVSHPEWGPWLVAWKCSLVSHSLLWHLLHKSAQGYMALCHGGLEQALLESHERVKRRWSAASDLVRKEYQTWVDSRGQVAPSKLACTLDSDILSLYQDKAAAENFTWQDSGMFKVQLVQAFN
eukprot:TRINITY_DN54962_c0_g1_i1.p1 TRINITY_DN54962_c0_g1~~TRINITY_DN54962_c0_g1_i1.p1  ORF type:complete len:342 (+),score=64.55 TRINITY_DN54962_c0_g1_i1:200-1225(+)